MADDNGVKPWESKTCHRSIGGTVTSCLGPQCTLWSERTAHQADGTPGPKFGLCADVAMGWDMNQAAIMLTHIAKVVIEKQREVQVPMDMNMKIIKARH